VGEVADRLFNQEKKIMKSTANLRDLGQSLWLDNITRNLLQGGLLRCYIDITSRSEYSYASNHHQTIRGP
jgi:hypothetical protein